MSSRSFDVSAWLRSAPVMTSADALAVVGFIATRIATRTGCEPPNLPSQQHQWATELDDDAMTLDVLGSAWESLIGTHDRRARGAHYTPRHLVDRVCFHAYSTWAKGSPNGRLPMVWDPACGGGAFLLGMARRLEIAGHDRPSIVRALHGSDIDEGAVHVAKATLELWCNGDVVPTVSCQDGLDPSTMSLADLVIGNPPFLGQLSSDTARTADRRTQIAARFDAAGSGYADDAVLFLLAAVDSLRPGGVASMIVPQSVLGASDATGCRSWIAERAYMQQLWVADDQPFAASVDVVVPTLVRAGEQQKRTTTIQLGDATPMTVAEPEDGNWASLLAIAGGTPPAPDRPSGRTLGDVATITAGFRQHFYGITGAVREARPDESDPLRLITSGAIEPLWLDWGDRVARFGGNSWSRPVLDLDEIPEDSVKEWFADRRRPKVLVASQTRVIEAVVDVSGDLMPSVPVISVEPVREEELFRIAAILSSPPAAIWIAHESAGTGLSARALRIRAKGLAALPLPSNNELWTLGAELASEAHEAQQTRDHDRHEAALRRLGEVMTDAYTASADIWEWWNGRLRFRTA